MFCVGYRAATTSVFRRAGCTEIHSHFMVGFYKAQNKHCDENSETNKRNQYRRCKAIYESSLKHSHQITTYEARALLNDAPQLGRGCAGDVAPPSGGNSSSRRLAML
jgi:hypothetical protein